METNLQHWTDRPMPGDQPMWGQSVKVEPIMNEARLGELADAFATDAKGALWQFMGYGPFADRAEYMDFARHRYLGSDAVFHAIVPTSSNRAEGVASLMRIDQKNGVIEIGQIVLAGSLQRSRAATEAFYLLFRRVFNELGYRRLEWKCDHSNNASRQAAVRLGFTHEGIFRHHMVVKGKNRDTAWYAIIDRDWPAIERAFLDWLADDNFNDQGQQIRSLREFRPD